jgi:hypothetical protein
VQISSNFFRGWCNSELALKSATRLHQTSSGLGEAPHFDYVCQGVTQGVIQVSLSRSKPVGFGVLTVDTLEQAIARSGVVVSKEDKGYDSAIAALELPRVNGKLNDRIGA